MSLTLAAPSANASTANNTATTMLHPHQPKPMAISTITSPPLQRWDDEQMDLHYRRPSSSSSYRSSSASSSPQFAPSPDYLQVASPPPSNNNSSDTHRRYSTDVRLYYSPYSQSQPTESTNSSLAGPLSLQERRRRNKAASAKYRAKKNQQHGEMRRLIASLTRENELLQRQLDHMSRENNRLKATCDNLRGKMMAAKMIHKLLGDSNGAQDDGAEQLKCSEQRLGLFMKRFEEDMDFDDDDELYNMEDETVKVDEKPSPSAACS
ncbi:hypothetical protein VTP01DRAFT_9576 [Rhizomucor pusillus]|uniref:uncharacterized protein n=1 Tax=Rhizomucor pusillus TaxID=4840 RepID=UPI00374390D4